MPRLFNRALGREEFVPNELLDAARASGDYDIPDDLEASYTTPAGRTVQGTAGDVALAADTIPFTPAPEASVVEREQRAHLEQLYGDSGERAFAEGALEGVTLGGYGAALRALDPRAARQMGQRESVNPYASTGGQIVGAVLPAVVSGGAAAGGTVARLAGATPAGAAARLGARIAGSGGGGVGRAVVGLGVEGAITGAGQGVHQVSMSEDPLTVEQALSTISTNALLGAGIGAGAGIVGKVAEKGIMRARRAVDEGAAALRARAGVAPDLIGLDAKGLRAARDVELEAIEAARVPERASVADEVLGFRQEAKQEKWWLAAKGDEDFSELLKVSLKADKRLDTLTDDVKGLRMRPQDALKPLRVQEQRLQELLDRGDEIRAKIAVQQAEAAAQAAPAPPAPARSPNIPTYDDLPDYRLFPDDAPEELFSFTQTVPIEELKPHLISIEGTIEGRMESIRRGLDEGKTLPPVDVNVLPNGRLFVNDGRHRLRVAAERGEPIEVKFSRGSEGADAGTEALFPEGRAAGPRDITTDLVSEDFEVDGKRLRLQMVGADDLVSPLDESTWVPRRNTPLAKTKVHARIIEVDEAGAPILIDDAPRMRGKVEFNVRDGELYPKNVEVDGALQRKGLASRMYQKAEELTGRKVVPSRSQTDAGKAFSQSYAARRDAAPAAGSAFNVGDEVAPGGYLGSRRDPLLPDHPAGTVEHVVPIDGKPVRFELTTSARTGEGTVKTTINAYDGDTLIGKGLLSHMETRAELYPNNVQVDPAWQRKGVASTMYRLAEESSGRKMIPGGTQTPQGRKLSEAYRARRAPAPKGKKKLAEVETGATRLAALDSAERLLQKNRALQERIIDLTPANYGGRWVPKSERLSAIEDAQAAIGATPKSGFLQETGQAAGAAYAVSAVTGLLPGGPVGAMAAVVAPKIVRRLNDWVVGRLTKASAASAERTAKAVESFFGAARTVARVTPPLATRVLNRVTFSPVPSESTRKLPLREAFAAREQELRDQVTLAPDGRVVMRPEARQKIGDQLAGVRVIDPQLADQMETHAAKRIEFYASKLPKRPDMGVMQIGPRPLTASDREIRSFARSVAAGEDGPGALERATNGMVTPEDAEALRELYPELLADYTRRLVEQLPGLKRGLPFHRRLALTVLTGVPVDPSLSPPVLRVMQGVYVEEPGSEGGTQAPRAQPQFGSVSREQGTLSQQRQERRAGL